MASQRDFLIEDDVLVKYRGRGGDVVIPQGVTVIADKAFQGCDSLTSVFVPEGVTSIGQDAFRDCENLAAVNLPDTVTYMSDMFGGIFCGCSSLVRIRIPKSVKVIGSCWFRGCKSLVSVEMPDGVWCIGERAFDGCSSLENLTIPESVTRIGAYAFAYCSNLESIVLPESVMSIGEGAFYGCEALERIRLPQAVEEILDEVLDVPYVICATTYAASHAKYPVYLGGSPYKLPAEVQLGAVEGFRYAMRHGIYEVIRWEDDYHRFSQEGVRREAPKRRRVVSGFDEILADMMADSFLDIEGLALETGLTEDEIINYLKSGTPSQVDVMDIAEGLGYDPNLFFESA